MVTGNISEIQVFRTAMNLQAISTLRIVNEMLA